MACCYPASNNQIKYIKVIAGNQFARDKLTLVSIAEAKALVFESG
jgi:hypothetical protein